MDPPGTVPPSRLFTFYFLDQLSQCSNTVPLELPVRTIIYDSIFIPQTGSVFDMDVNLTINHTNDEDLFIWLSRSGFPLLQMSTNNGGSGDNYTNTTFDDEASTPITEGFPPFTGSYRPQQLLSTFDNSEIQGTWKLRILNYSQTITGQLVNWCIYFQYFHLISVSGNQIPVRSSLSQNYPNPFNSSTSINYSLIRQSHVKIVVYDVLGREVRTLMNSRLSGGDYVLSFNSNDLASGLYFYSMYLDGELFETRKMVLIK